MYSVTSKEGYDELLCSRSTAFLEGLVAILRNRVWPQNIVDSSQQFGGFGGEDSSQYLCPSQQMAQFRERTTKIFNSSFTKFY